jgi:molecular chaperone DnaK (HSP70)
VPALWSEEHKHFMRQAAKEAAIITETSASSLLLCLEPEGASIQCREDSETALKETMVKESTVMVLDCGGGTVDITVHLLKCNPDERFVCEELLPSSGGCEWGSKFVDFAFETFLSELFGEEFY